ncbi:MAG: transposase [Anaerolineae bacterium]|nr:transposase [Anaerolineae bacterium]
MPKREFHPPHIYTQNAIYFLTASLIRHQHLLNTAARRDILRDVLKAAIVDYDIQLYAWAILPDHYHLLLQTGDDTPLYKFIKRLHGESAILLNKLDNTPGRKVWYQYWDRFPRNDKDFWAYFNYIHLNPIKHGYVQVTQSGLWVEGQLQHLAPGHTLDIHECLAQYAHTSYAYYTREYGKAWFEDIWAHYPIPNYFEYDDFENVPQQVEVLKPDLLHRDKRIESIPFTKLPELMILGEKAPKFIQALGDLRLLERPTLALFCSSKTPASIILHVHDLAQKWRVEGPTLISGFHSPAEQEALAVLLRGPQPVIVCPARSLARMRLKPEYKAPLAEGRLLLLSPFAEAIRRASAQTATQRNRFVAALADQILIAHAHPGSKTAQLAQEVTAWGKRVFTLDHPANVHLQLPVYTIDL